MLKPIESMLICDEGFEPTPYLDTKGNWTIGIGRFIGKDIRNLRISRAVAVSMLKEDIDAAEKIALRVFGEQFHSFDEPRRDVIKALIFNMGEGNEGRGFLSFRKMIAAIKDGRWQDAAKELLDSAWRKDVDPKCVPNKGRDDRMAFTLDTGTYHDDYKSYISRNAIGAA